MSKIHSLKISNYRGIKNYDQVFWMYDIINLFGKGGSGKTSILNAIYFALTPNSDMSFSYADFYKEDITNAIEIEVRIFEHPVDIRIDCMYNSFNGCLNEESNLVYKNTNIENEFGLTIKLKVKRDLKPKWIIVNRNSKESVKIIANYREHFNVLLFSFTNYEYIVCKDEKGSERQISFESIVELSSPGSIFLLDNLAEGVNPDKSKHLIKEIINKGASQIIYTSRSRKNKINLQ